MCFVRTTTAIDAPHVERLLRELDLDHPQLVMDNFWIAEEGGEVAGIAHLERFGGSFYLSAVGVDEGHRGEGTARTLLERIIAEAHGPIYLYTIIPDFFRKFGFVPADPAPEIPPRSIYDCRQDCDPTKCRSMVRERHDS